VKLTPSLKNGGANFIKKIIKVETMRSNNKKHSSTLLVLLRFLFVAFRPWPYYTIAALPPCTPPLHGSAQSLWLAPELIIKPRLWAH
jgi:hypothetical protein